MNKFNSYFDLQRTREKRQKGNDKKNIKLVNFKFLEEPKRNKMNFDIVFTQMNLNKKNINFLNNKGTSARKGILKKKKDLTNAETDKKINEDKTKALNNVEKTQKDNSMISYYDVTQKKINIHKFNSVAYIKKRPNDLIKDQNLNRSTIITKYSNSSLKGNGRCFSCTNIKNKPNILNNDDLRRTVSYYKEMISTTKKALFTKIKPFNCFEFSFKDRDDLVNRKKLSDFIDAILNIMKKHLKPIKKSFIQYINKRKKVEMHKVTFEEYKLLEELKSLGVSNKKELNLLLKDIYFEIKGKN